MKYAKRIPPTDPGRREALRAEGWKTMKEPSNLVYAILLSLPFMVLNAMVCYFVLFLVDSAYTDRVREFLFSASWVIEIRFYYIIFAYLLVVLHEFLHLVFIPRFHKSEKTYFGIKPWGGFVFTAEKLTKKRFLLISLAPFVILSLIMPAILGLAGLLGGFLLFLAFLNAFASSVDMLNAVLVAIQVPNGGLIVNNGFESYYSPATNKK